MSATRSSWRVAAALALVCAPAAAQTPVPPNSGQAPAVPEIVAPPGPVARGVIPPPNGVDPGIVTPPPVRSEPTMPVIKPPATSR